MQRRPGVTLVEVLVSAVLLMIGIGGTLQALATSARLRRDADRREAMVGLFLDRLAWFERLACAGTDTAGVTRLPDGPTLRWHVEADGNRRTLALQGVRGGDVAAPRSTVVTSRRCNG